MQFADIKNDVTFRKIFGNENRKDCLMSFLNAVLEFEGDYKIIAVEILNPYQLPKLRDGKVSIVDVKATDQLGRTYIIEMQVAELDGLGKRVLYYFAKSYSDQIERGDFYRQLKPVIFIGILDYVFTENPHFISRHQVRDVETDERAVQDVEFNFIELPKFTKGLDEIQTLTEKWIYFIKNAENLDVIPENINDNGLKVAYQEANKYTWTREELAAYDYIYMREEDERARFDAAMNRAKREMEKATREMERAKQDAEKATREMERAKQDAEEKGEKRGEQQEKIEIAKNAINKGADDEFIAYITGLPIEQIQALRATNGNK
jgi:predicted transposase/invertase (TIGR01784 family)